MAFQVQLNGVGGTEGFQLTETDVPSPGTGEVRIRQSAIGVNFIDIYHRTGVYALASFPAVLGMCGVGIVDEVGSGVHHLAEGDRVAYLDVAVGAYASVRLLEADRAVLVPAGIDDRLVAGSMLWGVTAHMLLTKTHRLVAGQTVLIHAAAGGLGQLLIRWAKYIGAQVIGTVSSEAKAAIARQAGADHALLHTRPDLEPQVKELSEGTGAHLVIDGIGAGMLLRSLACVRPFGTVASVGQAAGPIPPISVADIGRQSASLARPSVITYAKSLEDYQAAVRELFALFCKTAATYDGQAYALSDTALAHREMEKGLTRGSPVLMP